MSKGITMTFFPASTDWRSAADGDLNLLGQIDYNDLMMTIVGGPLMNCIWSSLQVLGMMGGIRFLYDVIIFLKRRICLPLQVLQVDQEMGVSTGHKSDREGWKRVCNE